MFIFFNIIFWIILIYINNELYINKNFTKGKKY